MGIIVLVLYVYSLILLTRVIFGYFQVREGTLAAQVYDILYTITEPVLAPIRSLIGPVGVGSTAFDFSPIIVFIVIQVLIRLLAP